MKSVHWFLQLTRIARIIPVIPDVPIQIGVAGGETYWVCADCPQSGARLRSDKRFKQVNLASNNLRAGLTFVFVLPARDGAIGYGDATETRLLQERQKSYRHLIKQYRR